MYYMDSSIVLHNMMIDFGGDGDFEGDNLTAVDDPDRIPEEEILDLQILEGASKGTCHDQLKVLVREKYVPSYNYTSLGSNVYTGKQMGMSLDDDYSELGDEYNSI